LGGREGKNGNLVEDKSQGEKIEVAHAEDFIREKKLKSQDSDILKIRAKKEKFLKDIKSPQVPKLNTEMLALIMRGEAEPELDNNA
jgi:hypothetical protein